ncbi:MAG: hypothetical protein KAU23_10140, partial [Anaerolineales bacterium]|nr:hypothetical protein [Anaerolineales bacterium]
MKNSNQITKHRGEEGQVVAYLAVVLVVLLGFAALALDGGMLLSDRRDAQNAADSASLAGGSAAAYYMRANDVNYNAFICGTSGTVNTKASAETEAIIRAASNDYVIDNDLSDKHGVNANCEIVDMGSYMDKYFDITTKITRDTTTNFAQLIYDGPLRNEVEAVTRVYPPAPLAFGKAIIALNESACSGNSNGVIFSGTSSTTVTGGGVWSNGCLKGDGASFNVTVN